MLKLRVTDQAHPSLTILGKSDAMQRSQKTALILIAALLGCVERSEEPLTEPGTKIWAHVSNSPTLVIGENSETKGEIPFTQIRSVLQLGNGNILVANSFAPPAIHFFDPSGGYQRTAGREGQGPGEFAAVTWIQRSEGDTVVVYDGTLARLTFLTSDGSVARTLNLPRSRFGSLAGAFSVICVNEETGYAVPTMLFNSSGTTAGRSSKPIVKVDLRSGRTVLVTTVPGTEYAPRPRGGGAMPVFFGLNTIVACEGGRLRVATGEDLTVSEYDSAGRKVRTYRAEQRPRETNGSDLDAELRRNVEDLPAKDRGWMKDAIRDLGRTPPRAKRFPAVGRYRTLREWAPSIITDDQSHIWVQRYVGPQDRTAVWAVFDTSGTYLGNVETPREFWIMDVGTDNVLGMYRDSLGMESVRVYDLVFSAQR